MKNLLSLLQSIQQQSRALLQCLQLEKKALDNHKFEQLNELADEKQALLNDLQQLEQQRMACCGDKNFTNFINSSQNPQLIKQWQVTRKTIAACRQQNEVNGRLISKQSLINQDILSILTGGNRHTDSTYNAQGNQTGSASLLNGVEA